MESKKGKQVRIGQPLNAVPKLFSPMKFKSFESYYSKVESK